MEIKKSASKNLERKRGLYFQLGLVISLSFSLLAFQYTTHRLIPVKKEAKVYPIDEQIIPITIIRSTKPLPKPAPPKPITDQIKVVKTIAVTTPNPKPIQPIELPPEIIIADIPLEIIDEDIPLPMVQVMPGFGDCSLLDWASRAKCTEAAIQSFIIENLEIPRSLKDRGEGGRVFVSFVVNRQGNVTDVKILKGLAGGKDLDKEVVRVVKLLPQFTPGEQMGRKASVRYTIPVNVRIG
jgi:protein TonB